MTRIAFLVAAALVAALGLVIGTLNADPVHLDLLWVQLNWPLGLVLLASLSLGIAIGVLMTWLVRVLPLRAHLRTVKRRQAESEASASQALTETASND
ncbi:LapA family protein [Marinihelvus fidelis]|uniref:LapA family protein n=1 Tax=Marinihelvus fidelis TaxID=2613842 RepID=A0A5N0TDZ1_9GAMM|nr:LapA family protein [Marinihelvus fidelis]KAA9132056.1 LapA family protein [Marinihelvus fidelis]